MTSLDTYIYNIHHNNSKQADTNKAYLLLSRPSLCFKLPGDNYISVYFMKDLINTYTSTISGQGTVRFFLFYVNYSHMLGSTPFLHSFLIKWVLVIRLTSVLFKRLLAWHALIILLEKIFTSE